MEIQNFRCWHWRWNKKRLESVMETSTWRSHKRSRKAKQVEGNNKYNSKNQLTRKWKNNTENKWHQRWFFKKIDKINKPLARLTRGLFLYIPNIGIQIPIFGLKVIQILVIRNIVTRISCIICANNFELRWNGHIAFTFNISSKKESKKAENTLRSEYSKMSKSVKLGW